MSLLNERGHEVPDDTPVAMPVGFRKPESLQDQIRRLVRNELSARAMDQGLETFEEADDFDVEDDNHGEFTSKHELDDEQARNPTPAAARSEIERIERRIAKRANRRRRNEESGDVDRNAVSDGADAAKEESGISESNAAGRSKSSAESVK